MVDQCGLLLGTFNKLANWHDTDDMLAELSRGFWTQSAPHWTSVGEKVVNRFTGRLAMILRRLDTWGIQASTPAMCRSIPPNTARSGFSGRVVLRNGGGQQCDQPNPLPRQLV